MMNTEPGKRKNLNNIHAIFNKIGYGRADCDMRKCKIQKHVNKFILFSLIVIISEAYGVHLYAEALSGEEKKLLETYENIPLGRSDGWYLVKEKRGIKVSWRRVSITPVKAFKGEMELETDLNTLTAFLMDDENVPQWVTHAQGSKVIKRFSETQYYVYQTTKLPWPASPRDSVVFRSWEQDSETLSVTAKAIGVPNYIPEREGFIRIPLVATYFKITPLDNGKVNLVWETIIDPSGWVPVWIVNLTITYAPYDTFCNIQDLMPLEKYQEKKFNWIRNIGESKSGVKKRNAVRAVKMPRHRRLASWAVGPP